MIRNRNLRYETENTPYIFTFGNSPVYFEFIHIVIAANNATKFIQHLVLSVSRARVSIPR